MTQISKGEEPPVPAALPHVGKTAGPGTGPGTGSGVGPGTGTGSGAGLGKGPGAGAPLPALPPRRVDAADAGPWAELIAAAPAPAPGTAEAAAALGGTFDTLVYTGRGDARFAMEEKPPPGYVLVEFARTGTGWFDLHSIDWNGREAVALGGADTPGRFEQRTMWCDNLYPLRFRVDCGEHDDWVIVVRPVSGARALGAGATGRGTQVLLHTGPAAELAARFAPDKNGDLRVDGHRPRRPDAPAPSPDVLASAYRKPYEDARALPEGPVLVAVVRGEGAWSLEVREPRPEPAPAPRGGFWSRLFGR